MKKVIGTIIASILLAAGSLTACAADNQTVQPDLVMRTGSNENSTYSKLYREMVNVCRNPVVSETFTHGSIQALDGILNNDANLAFIQSDVVIGRKLIENDPQVDDVRVFMPLYYSELHIVAQRNNQNLNRFSDLSQKKVGTYGGAYITSRILFSHTGVAPFQLLQYNTEKDALDALAQGKIDVVMIVDGQPASWAKALPGSTFKLVPFDRMDVLSRVGAYAKASLRYPNLSQTTVPSIGVQIDLFTYNYHSRKKVEDLSKFKSCVESHIDDLRETTGNHPKWHEIKPSAKVTYWPMFTGK